MPRSRRRLVWYTRFKTLFEAIHIGSPGYPQAWNIGVIVYDMLSGLRVFRYRWIAQSARESLVLAALDAGIPVPNEVLQSTDMHGHRPGIQRRTRHGSIDLSSLLEATPVPTILRPRRVGPVGPTDDIDERG